MKPKLLLVRAEVKAILKISNETIFKALMKKQWVPAPIGCYKKQHLWCSATIYKLAERNQKMGISLSRDLTEDILLECLIDTYNRQAQ
jgi:hypothetical protein